MHRNLTTTIGLVVGFCLVATGPAAAADDDTKAVGPLGEAIVQAVREAHAEAGFRGAVLAARGGEVIAAVAVGPLEPGGDEPLRVDSLFEIASCTKPFTAVAVMRLVEEGRLSLDDPIATHLPGVPADCRAITVRHLLQHTSGIPGTNSSGRGDDLAAVLPLFLRGGPQTPPGQKHAYWNQGYALLSEVIAQASRGSYVGYMKSAVLSPAKMASTRFTGHRAPRDATVAIGASVRGADRSALEHPYGAYGFQCRGMGGLVTNLIDLWRWDRTLARGGLLSSESIEEMTRPGDAGYALGWRVGRVSDGAVFHYHTGSVRGFLASIRRYPSFDGAVFVLAASDDTAPFAQATSTVHTLLETGRLPVDRSLAAERIARLEGVYRDTRGRTLAVSREGEHAAAQIDWGGPVSRGYLAAGDDEGLLFGLMPRYTAAGFADADTIEVHRDGDTVVALSLVIAAADKTIRFDRVER